MTIRNPPFFRFALGKRDRNTERLGQGKWKVVQVVVLVVAVVVPKEIASSRRSVSNQAKGRELPRKRLGLELPSGVRASGCLARPRENAVAAGSFEFFRQGAFSLSFLGLPGT